MYGSEAKVARIVISGTCTGTAGLIEFFVCFLQLFQVHTQIRTGLLRLWANLLFQVRIQV